MRHLMVVVGAAAVLVASSLGAFADQVMGTITNIDAKAGTVTLDSGKVYFLSGTLSESIMVGDVVSVTFKADQGGKLTASSVDEAYQEPY